MTTNRVRMRPASREDSQETRTAGATVSETSTTTHKPVNRASIIKTDSGVVVRLTVKDGVTLNMGNYNSFRRDIGLEVDIALTQESALQESGALNSDVEARIEMAYESVQAFVSDLVSDAIHDAQQYFKDLD